VLHFVGHSLGGALILTMLARQEEPRVGRVVLLGSPCGGSYCARVLQGIPVLRTILGRSIRDWLASALPKLPAQVPVGVLAGTRSIGLGRLVPGLPRPNDGVVAVTETRLPGSADAITLRVAHAEMLASRACAEQVVAFLHQGRFRHA
jgi:pimeloyl-ACP methyl ester carboxylesterase